MVSDNVEWAHRFNSHHIRIPICSTSLFRKQERDKIQNMAMLQFVQSVFQFDKILFRPSFVLCSPSSVVGRFHESLDRRHLSIYLIIGQGELSCYTSNPPGSVKEPLMLRPQLLPLAFLVHPEPGRVCGYIILWLTDDCTYHFNVLHLRRI